MVVKSSYRLIRLISSGIMGGWPWPSSAAGVVVVEWRDAAGELTVRPENLLQSRRSDAIEGERMEVVDARVGVIPTVGQTRMA